MEDNNKFYKATFQKMEDGPTPVFKGAFGDLPREGRRFVFLAETDTGLRMTTTTPIIAIERGFVDGIPEYRFVTRNSIYQVKVTNDV